MNYQELGKYIVENEEFSIPELQKKFQLSYATVRKFIQNLIQRGKVSPLDELKYFYIKNDEDPLYIYTLWLVVDSSNCSLSYLQKKLNTDDATLKTIILWMQEKGYVKTSPFDSVILSKEKFLSLYGPLYIDSKDPDPFLTWKLENEEKIKKYLKPKTPKKFFSDKEYYETLESLCRENPKGSQEDFITILENKFKESKDDHKMSAIFMKMIGEIVLLNEKQFQSLREIILS